MQGRGLIALSDGGTRTDPRRRTHRVLVATLLVLGILASLAVTSVVRAAPAAAGTVGSITSYPIGVVVSGEQPSELVSSPDGTMYFEYNETIGRVTTQGLVTDVIDPSVADVSALTADASDGLWYATYASATDIDVHHRAASGATTSHPVDPTIGAITQLVYDSEGNLWYRSETGVGRISAAGVLTPHTGGWFLELVKGPAGTMWSTAVGVAGVYRFAGAGEFALITFPFIGTVNALTQGPDGTMWVGHTFFSNYISRISVAGVKLSGVVSGAGVSQILVTGPDGNVWGASGASILRITPAGVTTVFGDASVSYPNSLIVGPDEALWFTNRLTHSIGRVDAGAPFEPAAPAGVTATAGYGQATVSWSASTTTGGPVTAYTVTAAPGGAVCVWTTGPLSCPVTGLTNGQSYTFTVTATNAQGTSAPSVPSSAVTPWGIASLSSSAGPISGGQLLIRGVGFTGATAVKFATTPAPYFLVVDDTAILVLVPPRPAGFVNVSVTTPAGISAPGLQAFYSYSATAPGSISGTVNAAIGGAPLAGMLVCVMPAGASTFKAFGATNATGAFSIANLPPGAYKVAVFDLDDVRGEPSHYLAQYYDAKGTPSLPEAPASPAFGSATVVTVTTGAASALNPVQLAHTP